MFSIVELKATALNIGVPGISPTLMLLLFVMMLSISMIPYLFLFLSLREKQTRATRPSRAMPFRKMTAWVQAHRHPELLHH